jgi:hypothetical protein
MSRTRLSPIDIVGITLGTIVIIVVIGSIALLARNHGFFTRWNGPGFKFWTERPFQHGAPLKAPLREEKDEQVSGNFTTLEIRNIAGEIDIHAGTTDSVGVHSIRTAMFPGAMENLTVGIEKRGDRLLVEERHAAGFFMSAGTVAFDITLPKSIRTIEAHSVSGSITVHDVAAGITERLTTISGSISTSRAGDLEASSTSGSVQFGFSGSRLDARTVSGSIEGRIGSLNQGGSVDVRSVSGSVDLDAYDGLDAVVSLRSVSGGVSCAFPLVVTEQKRNSLSGKIGNGSSRLDVSTTSGTISIKKM